MRMCAREAVRQSRNHQRRRMGGHVPAVRDERHGTVDRSSDNLGDHHCGGEGYNKPGPALARAMRSPQKNMLVLPRA
jgi:hypothetical protein